MATRPPTCGHVDAEPFGGKRLGRRQAGKRLGREHHLGVIAAGGEPAGEAAGLVAQGRLVDQVRGGPEAVGQLADPDAPDHQLPVRRDRAVLGEQPQQVHGRAQARVEHEAAPTVTRIVSPLAALR
jgi:hypothetical protein